MIYIVRRPDGLIKIGTAVNVERRLAELTKSHGSLEVIRIIHGDRRREVSIHAALKRHNQFGEWFRDGEELRAFIADLPDGTYADMAETDAQKTWRLGEEQCAAEGRTLAERILGLRSQLWGDKTEDETIADLCAEYGFTPGFFIHVAKGRAYTISAWGLRVLRTALISEMEAARQTLVGYIEEEAANAEQEAGRLRLVISKLDDEREAAMKAAS